MLHSFLYNFVWEETNSTGVTDKQIQVFWPWGPWNRDNRLSVTCEDNTGN